MLTYSRGMITLVEKETERQLALLPRKDIAARSLRNSSLVLLESEEKCLEAANLYAPEHLIIATPDPIRTSERVTSRLGVPGQLQQREPRRLHDGTESCPSRREDLPGASAGLPSAVS